MVGNEFSGGGDTSGEGDTSLDVSGRSVKLQNGRVSNGILIDDESLTQRKDKGASGRYE